MPAAGWVSSIIATLIIAVAGLGLLQVIIHLSKVTKALATLQVGVENIAVSTATVTPTVVSVNANLAPVRAWCEGV